MLRYYFHTIRRLTGVFCAVSEYQVGEIRLTSTPQDAVRIHGQGVEFNCSVDGLGYKDALSWWHVTSWGLHTRIFVSHPEQQVRHFPPTAMNPVPSFD